MNFPPEWAPNIHPLLIHFPIVLLLLAPLLDLCAILFKKQQWLKNSANLIYVLAGLGLIITYFSGRLAADSVDIPTQAYTTLSRHADLALYTLILGGLNAIIRGVFLFRGKKVDWQIQWYWLIPGLIVASLMIFTADKGAKLVYAHGLGVTVAQEADHHQMKTETSAHDDTDEHSHSAYTNHAETDEHTQLAENSHEDADEHSHSTKNPLIWSASQASEVENDFQWILGNPENLNLKIVQDNHSSALQIKADDQELFFVLPASLENLEFQAKLNRDDFDGIVRLVHHVSTHSNYDFLEIEQEVVKQGRISDGILSLFDSAEHASNGWVDLKVVSTGGHFRGYIDESLLTHGHGADLPAGKLGMYVNGTGTLRIKELNGIEIK